MAQRNRGIVHSKARTRTTIVNIDRMMSIFDGLGIEKRLLDHSGIVRVEANFLGATATVEYDENLVSLDQIKQLVSACGYECSGECLPQHICKQRR